MDAWSHFKRMFLIKHPCLSLNATLVTQPQTLGSRWVIVAIGLCGSHYSFIAYTEYWFKCFLLHLVKENWGMILPIFFGKVWTGGIIHITRTSFSVLKVTSPDTQQGVKIRNNQIWRWENVYFNLPRIMEPWSGWDWNQFDKLRSCH